MAFRQRHDGLLDVRLHPRPAARALEFALADERIDALDLHVEQLLHRLLDLRLGGGSGDVEDHLVMLGRERRLLGDHRRDDDVVMVGFDAAHLKRASRASSAARVRTSLVRRRMSYTLMPCTGSTSMSG